MFRKPLVLMLFPFIIISFFWIAVPYANAGVATCSDSSFCTVFTTSTVNDGNLQGLAGADAICNARAAAANLPGTYKAWLADRTTAPSATFAQSTVPYQLTNGTLVANDYTDLTSGTIQNPIDRDESAVLVTSRFEVWTNVNTDGTQTTSTAQNTCDGWTSNPVTP